MILNNFDTNNNISVISTTARNI